MDRARDELESQLGCSEYLQTERFTIFQSCGRVVSESSQNRQSQPIREATSHPEQMTEFLEASMATKRNERIPATRIDEALERFLKFRPPLIGTDENKMRQFVKGLRVELQRALALLPPMGFVAAVEVATWTEMSDQVVIQRKTAICSAATPYKCLGQGLWKPRDSKIPVASKGLEIKADQP
ncbi:hypothetical protein M9H77_22525 [Catharanthus roseus]|uniref:Uncharacterized protein n=1 Tax=Catharanthus roseus TaxID=4058 RepID=A0ACC0ARY7_CATRO|nr:hypothetical protein M9H77_22525 [Catharanthus roseus]